MLRVRRSERDERAVHGTAEPVSEAGPVLLQKGHSVDQGVDLRLEPLQQLVTLSGGDPAGLDRLVEPFLPGGDQRLLETVDGLALGPRDLGQRLAVA